MGLFIGIDCGTQSTKGIVFDAESGEVRAQARAIHTMIRGLPAGHQEQHPRVWLAALDAVLHALLARVPAENVRGLGVSGQQHGFVPLDAAGKVIRPAKLWCDTSTTAECALLTERIGGERRALQKIGLRFLPGFTAPKILWLKRHEPRHYRRLRHVLLPHDFLNFHLTGEYFMEYGDASGTALMDVRKRKWSPEALKAVGAEVEGFLPPLSSSRQICGTLRTSIAQRYGFRTDTFVSAGGGDNMMGAIGTGNVSPGTVTASLGTSGTIYAHTPKPVVDPTGEIAAFCDSTDAWLPLLCTMNVTNVTEAFRVLFDHTHATAERAIARIPAGADGLMLLPYFVGERTPSLPRGTGVLFGLTPETTTEGHMLRAAWEGVTLGLNYGLQRLRALGVRPREIRLTGGGAKSALWRQLASDIFGVPVVALKEDEGAALGGALQAAACAQPVRERRTFLRTLAARTVHLDTTTRCVPDPARHAVYREMQKRHDALRTTLTPHF